jgi:hypothetical protein
MRKLWAVVAVALAAGIWAVPAEAKTKPDASGSVRVEEGSSLTAADTAAADSARHQLCATKGVKRAHVTVRAGSVKATFNYTCASLAARAPRPTVPSTTTTTTPPTTLAPTTLPPPPPTVPVNPPCMSFAEFDAIQAGMSHDEIAGIVGGPGTLSVSSNFGDYQGEIWMWTGCGGIGANANVQFQNGAEITKAQFGLR